MNCSLFAFHSKPLPMPHRHEVFIGTIRSPKRIPITVSGITFKHAAMADFVTKAGCMVEIVTLSRSFSRTLFKIGNGGEAIISGFRNSDGVLIADEIKEAPVCSIS
jgi:hypothetical protein